ncbi:OmpP1/FadL family transporter [Prevotella bivia]|uniref:OmpP1/FadL family transporter n=1 Tax=Prevotella bivia TaxID=28125 RepID=UPI0006611BEC|nr:hemin receptor [Prevotella bivia]
MKKKYYFFAAALLIAMSVNAQETYQNAKLTTQDLNGTARYIGMGGALEALGADVSTISSNPAGIGLFRHNNISVSGGLVVQGNGTAFSNGKKTNASFDQIGGVYSMRTGRTSYLNFGFNYHKGRNFDYILNAANALNGSSLNNQSYAKGELGSEGKGGYYVDLDRSKPQNDKRRDFIGYSTPTSTDNALNFDQLDYLNFNTINTEKATGNHYGYNASAFDFNRAYTGYIGNYDFNVSGNLNNRVYLGITLGIKDVHYKSYSEYFEQLDNAQIGYANEKEITGNGFDITAGIIVRPVESSAFRIGAYVKSPTWYDLRAENNTQIETTEARALNLFGKIGNTYDYKFFTPWKFGISLGHTVGNYLALGATYEYEDYSTINSRVNDGGYYDWYYDEYRETSSPDCIMNNHTKQVLRGVSTLKLGAEYKPVENLAIRLGYNYVSSAYKENGQKDPTLSSLGNAYSSEADFVNWKDINRFTVGLGYQIKKFNIDLAYQYSAQKGDFYPFSNLPAISYTTGTGATAKTTPNFASATKVENNRSQFLLTLGYQF